MNLPDTTIVELQRIRRGQIVTYSAVCLNGFFIGESGPVELEDVLRQRIYKRCGFNRCEAVRSSNARTSGKSHRYQLQFRP